MIKIQNIFIISKRLKSYTIMIYTLLRNIAWFYFSFPDYQIIINAISQFRYFMFYILNTYKTFFRYWHFYNGKIPSFLYEADILTPIMKIFYQIIYIFLYKPLYRLKQGHERFTIEIINLSLYHTICFHYLPTKKQATCMITWYTFELFE